MLLAKISSFENKLTYYILTWDVKYKGSAPILQYLPYMIVNEFIYEKIKK